MPSKLTLIHLTDLHVGKSKQATRHAGELADWISFNHPGARVLVTGDLTQDGRSSQCRRAANLLAKLAETNPVLTVPGNHDYGFTGLVFERDSWKNYYSHLALPLGDWGEADTTRWLDVDEPGLGVLVDDHVVFLGLDSSDPKNVKLAARGYISEWLAGLLVEALVSHKGKTRIVMLHHHPFRGGPLTALSGTRRLVAALRNNCELLLFGHHHHFGIWWDHNEVPLTVGSHRSTLPYPSGSDHMSVGIVDILDPGTPKTQLAFRMESVEHRWLIAA